MWHDFTCISVEPSGYEQWCCHHHEIDRKIEHWCRATESNKRYLSYRNFPKLTPFREVYGEVPEDGSVTRPKNQNELKAEAASQRIKDTVEKLKSEGNFPDGAVARTEAIAIASKEIFGTSISTSTLRKKHNLSLWHPKHVAEETQSESEVFHTSNSKTTKSDRVENYIQTKVSHTLPPMKCKPQAEADGQILQEQAPPGRACQPVTQQSRSPLPQENLNFQNHHQDKSQDRNKSEGKSESEDKNESTVQPVELADADRPMTKILSAPMAEFSKFLELQRKLDASAKTLTKEEICKKEGLYKKYPGKYPDWKTISKSDYYSIESSWRARLYWESGSPRLMKKAEEIWEELDDW